jgi:N-acetyl-1-D-myo-inositol-2-amino-2-deoxy-alpha-D-glucopyranoside deacetylase/mycothiol S-conjugate amidase
MNRKRTLCFIGAHPDDETSSMGSTLAYYATAGVNVYYICATRGEAGMNNLNQLGGFKSLGELRSAELGCAAKILGLAGVIHLGYRDSGMLGTDDNKHPESLAAAPIDEVSERIVKVIRSLKPDVVVTHDSMGGYGHPDHVAVHNATVKAFGIVTDPAKYPEAGPAFQPQKLYFHVFPRKLLKVTIKLMPFFGQDPHHFGQNKDVDLASLVEVVFPIHAVIRPTKAAIRMRNEAMLCYESQRGSSPPRRNFLFLIRRFIGQQDSFMRAYPSNKRGREHDLFENVS